MTLDFIVSLEVVWYCRNMPVSDTSSFLRPDDVLRKIGLRAEQTLVHLGCGAGFWLIPAAQIVGASGKAIGVDIRPDILSEAESRAALAHLGHVVQTTQGDLEHDRGSGLADGLADLVLVANIIHQANPEKLLMEAKRILKADGKIAVVEWDVAASPLGPPSAKRIAAADMKKIVQSLGLTVQKSFHASPYHYGLILQKSQ